MKPPGAAARRCLSLLQDIAARKEAACAFQAEVQELSLLLLDLRPLLEELSPASAVSFGPCVEALEAALDGFSRGLLRCCTQGPLQTLLGADGLLHGLVDACVGAREALRPLEDGALPTLLSSQARLLGRQLEGAGVNIETLRRLRSTLYELEEEAERVRVGACDGAAFSALLTHLTVGCKPQQLASDVAFLQQELRAAEQQLRHVRASLLRRMGDVVAAIAGPLLDQQLPDWQQEPGTQQGPKCSPSPRSEERPDVGHKGEGERLQSLGEAPQACAASRQQSVGRTEAMEEVGGTAPAESAGGDGEMQLARAVAVLAGGAAASGEARLGAVEALCTVLSGAAAEPAAQVIGTAGATALLRQLQVGSSGAELKAAALRALVALVTLQPDCGQVLVAARAVPLLTHILNSYLESSEAQGQGAPSPGHAEGEWSSLGHGSVLVRLGPAASSPGKAVHKRPGQQQLQQQRQQAEKAGTGAAAAAVAPVGGSAGECEVCHNAVLLLKRLAPDYVADMLQAGTVPALCRAVGLPGGGPLAAAAACVLSEALHDTGVALQATREDLLVRLSQLQRHNRATELAAARSCTSALLGHAAQLRAACTAGAGTGTGTGSAAASEKGSVASSGPTPPGGLQASGGNSGSSCSGGVPGPVSSAAQLCAEMGRACSTASVEVLVGMVVEAQETSDGLPNGPNDSGWEASVGAAELLPFCLATPEARGVLLRHALACVCQRAAAGEAWAAAAALRLAAEESGKTATVRCLAQLLAAGGTTGPSPAHAATAALLLGGALRPAAGRERDRSALRCCEEACGEVQQCGALRPLLQLGSSPDAACRNAGLAALCVMALYSSLPLRDALAAGGGVVLLAEACRHEAVPLPSLGGPCPAPPLTAPNTLGQAAAEALAALSAASAPLCRAVCSHLMASLGGSAGAATATALAASACHVLSLVVAGVPEGGPTLVSLRVMGPLAAHIQGAPSAMGPGTRQQKQLQDDGDAEGRELLQARAVRLLWALCRGGGPGVEAAVAAGAPVALLQRGAMSGAGQGPGAPSAALAARVEAAAALHPLVKKSEAAREAALGGGALGLLLDLARECPPGLALWDEALGALAVLAAARGPGRGEALRALRQMLVRGGRHEAAAAATVASRMSCALAGREALLSEELLEPLVRLLAAGDDTARAAAASALCHLAVPASLPLPPCPALAAGGSVRPKLLLVRAGAVPALLDVLRGGAGAGEGAQPRSGSAAGKGKGEAAPPSGAVLLQAAEALECLAGGEEGVKAIRSAGGVDVLKEVVARGKRRQVLEATARAAASTLTAVLSA